MTNALTASFGLDLAPLKRDFAQAEAIGKTGAAKVQQAMANAANVTRSTRGSISDYIRREQESIQQFIQTHSASGRRIRTARDFAPAPKGKYPSPMDDESGAAGGFLRGARLLTVAYAIQRMGDAYKRAAEEAYKLKVAQDNLNRPQGAFAGDGAYEERLNAIGKARETAFEQKAMENQSWFSKMKAGFGILRDWTLGYGSPKEQGRQEANNRAEQAKRAAEAVSFMADKQNELNKADRLALAGEERKAALLRAEITHRERLAQLAQMEAAAGVNNPAARNAENERAAIDIAQINRQFPGPEAHQVKLPQPTSPRAYLRSPDAYDRHPDAYASGDTRTADDKMLPGRRSGLDWFRDHPRNFGPMANILKNTDPEFYRSGAGAMIGGGASLAKNAALSPGDKHEGAKDLAPILQQIYQLISKVWE